ncbi:toprim domain-containing protein [Alkalihalobacillus hemicellulosilyticus]|uniref:Toprim domain protein n=1 Tax=Halalkalibacter hemicellulosilyticusJCM 9152 TaxID=1236971 RepID=W4QEG5_9BACI|nr:toprim domain-containing protein [Halalkalibacter hemicellulosilyticus]GAE30460.1 toprim domain protein [Halalkalibacter hemicellulosilyticusJCM 9152]
MVEKVLIVEGSNDRKRVKKVLNETVTIVCTHGTLSNEKLEEIILPIENEDVYVLVDADESGEKIRKQLKHELPNAVHLYTLREYGQVETTPLAYLAQVLRAYFQVRETV